MIDVGGGTKPHPRADVVIDLRHPKGAPAQDARTVMWLAGNPALVIPAGSVDEVYASHFLEHIEHGQPLIDVMNEAWRVLRPGGSFTIIVPLIGFTDAAGNGQAVQSWHAYADPTHVSHWWFPEALRYFTGEMGADADYGIRQWRPLGRLMAEDELSTMLTRSEAEEELLMFSCWGVRGGWEGVARLVKP